MLFRSGKWQASVVGAALIGLTVMTVGASAAAATRQGPVNLGAERCDRRCLMYTMTQWTEAVLTNDLTLGGRIVEVTRTEFL
jgi:hypothetical protein